MLKEYTIKLGQIEIIVCRKKVQNLRLTVFPGDGTVKISSPVYTSNKIIKSFILSKMKWIEKQQEKFSLQERPTIYHYVRGENHFYLGKLYTLEIIYSKSKQGVTLDGDSLILSVRPGSNEDKRKRILNEWYRGVLKEQIPVIIDNWAKIIGDKPLEWGVKNMKTRWGSCNTQAKRIWLSLKLAEKSIQCLEYVVIHEMVHLLERGHGKAFILHMDRVIPDWRSKKKQLNQS